MKKFLILFTLSLVSFSISANDLVANANNAYTQGNYTEAIEGYTQALETQGESAEVYYNLGNCFYRLDQIASSILNYERALLLDPGNKDIRFNLEIAKLKTVDKIEPLGEFFLTEWSHSLENIFSSNQWSGIAIACFVLFVACLFLFFFGKKIILKKVGFFCGIALLIFCICANVFAYNQKKRLTERNTAIIFAPTITIKSSPDNSGTDLFILHEGTKVEVKNKLGDWNEIETADGNVGWINSSEIEII